MTKSPEPSRLYSHCMELLSQKRKELEETIAAIQVSANSETKSTAGDKHETARAMAQLDVEMLSRQLTEADKSIDAMKRIHHPAINDKAQPGSVITTSAGIFYLTVSLGSVEISGVKVMVISPEAPIAKVLIGKQAGDEVAWGGRLLTIHSVKN
jgi:transcription elongation GreA/GreB family factor